VRVSTRALYGYRILNDHLHGGDALRGYLDAIAVEDDGRFTPAHAL
jgi:hypothetical protein